MRVQGVGQAPSLDLPRLAPDASNITLIDMAKGSKKGACSANVQPAKKNCLEHNRRNGQNDKYVPSYVNPHLSDQNHTIFEDDMIKGRKSIVPLVKRAELLYTEKTGQKCQKSFTPFREDVLSLPGRGDITDEQIMKFLKEVEAKTGWKPIGAWYHKDEGYAHSNYIEGDENFECNYHVQVLYYCQDPETGKAIRPKRNYFSLRQDWLADATGMERGNPASETGRKRRSAMQQRIVSQEQRIDDLERLAKEREEKYRKEIERLEAEKKKAVEKAKASTLTAVANTAKGVANLFGRDKEVNALKATVKAQEGAIEGLRADLKSEMDRHATDAVKARQDSSALKKTISSQADRIQELTRENIRLTNKISLMEQIKNKLAEVADYAIKFITKGTHYLWMRDSFNEYCDMTNANDQELRHINAQRVAIECIHALDSSQLRKLDVELDAIVKNPEVGQSLRV